MLFLYPVEEPNFHQHRGMDEKEEGIKMCKLSIIKTEDVSDSMKNINIVLILQY